MDVAKSIPRRIFSDFGVLGAELCGVAGAEVGCEASAGARVGLEAVGEAGGEFSGEFSFEPESGVKVSQQVIRIRHEFK